MEYYVVKYTGPFGFIKPWTAVRDAGGGETYSQQFLTPSIIEGMRQKMEVSAIERHKLQYSGISIQQEVIKAKSWAKGKNGFTLDQSIIKRGVMIHPVLYLVFPTREDAVKASCQSICLCRNEDILLPDAEILVMREEEFNEIDGFELRFGKGEYSFMVGYNRFDNNREMYGYLEITGNPIKDCRHELL